MKINRIIINIVSLLTLLISSNSEVWACRFTVREIGFSILSQTKYTLIVADDRFQVDDANLRKIDELKRDCNVNVLLLSPSLDSEYPAIKLAKESSLQFPCVYLLSSDNKILPLESNVESSDEILELFHNRVTSSAVRERYLRDIELRFATVVWLEGNDSAINSNTSEMVDDCSERLHSVMSLMPKIVKKGVRVVRVSRDDIPKESVLLWSLGFNFDDPRPQAVILYGRGRIMGEPLNYDQIKDSMVYRYLSMIGADCECGLDRKWMLGRQIPLMWNSEVRQRLANELTFDVDNPAVLAEMSRIMAKEEIVGLANNGTSFTPENINLDEALAFDSDNNADSQQVDESEQSSIFSVIVYTLISIFVISIIAVVIILIRRRLNS